MPNQHARTLSSFMQISLDGYYCDAQGDMSFAHKPPDDAEWNAFVSGNAAGGGMLLFGRITYEMMATWWPTPVAAAAMPDVAAAMNARPKIVFSRTLHAAGWQNTTVISDDIAAAVRQLKAEPGPDMAILGSASIVMQLAAAGLIDIFQVVICPVALGAGRALFAGLPAHLPLALTQTRVFANGSVVLWYAPHR